MHIALLCVLTAVATEEAPGVEGVSFIPVGDVGDGVPTLQTGFWERRKEARKQLTSIRVHYL